MGCVRLAIGGGAKTPEEMVQAEEMCLVQTKGGLATSYVSCCSCMVRAARVVLMLFSETFCLFVDGDQREFDLETRVITNEDIIISKIFHSCALNK